MRLHKILLVLLFLSYRLASDAQTNTTTAQSKIKVILLGTFHFGETSDRHKTIFADEFSAKRQQELEQLAIKLAAQHPDKIFIEAEPKKQGKIDSLYNKFSRQQLTDSTWLRNEIVQVGFRTAFKTGSKAKLVGVDHRQELPYEVLQQYEKAHEKDSNPPFFDTPYPFSNAASKKLSESDLRSFYIQLNDQQARQRSMYDYLHYALLYGTKDDYTGVDFATTWYSRNLKILTNVFRALEPNDKCIVILMGSAHTALLHELLVDHPRFELADLTSVL